MVETVVVNPEGNSGRELLSQGVIFAINVEIIK